MTDLSGLVRLVTRDIWFKDYTDAGRRQLWIIMVVRWFYMVWYGFFKDKCLLRSASLAYATILSIAPVLAVAFSISKALGALTNDVVRELLLRVTAGRTELVEQILNYISNTNVKTLGYVGVGTLFVIMVALINAVEAAFNEIWGVVHGRTVWRKFTDFFTVLLICPLFVFLAMSFTVSMQNAAVVQGILRYTAFNYLYVGLLKIAPFTMVWLAFFFLYSFVPNTKVKWYSALIGGIIAGSLWQLAQWTYIEYQVGVSRYNAIYGSFAQFPIFLAWMYISWVIVLLGAEMSFAVQNLKVFLGEVRAERIGQEGLNRIAVLIMLILTKAFEEGSNPPGNQALANRLATPLKSVNEITRILARAGIISKLDNEDVRLYTLAKPPEKIMLTDIPAALGRRGEDTEVIAKRFRFINETMDRIAHAAIVSEANTDLKSYYQRLCDSNDAECL